ncbi:MAG: sulfatase-like hydrolase/transferase [Chloroflexi bacterium]|nr:sulfatase-like hydrolase/transferase [Chloroflexota bacterium]
MSNRPSKPNLLFIFSDQQRADTMAAYGNDWIETPGMNRLADTGSVIENCYVSSPICTPSRSTIMTGTWPHTNGAYKNNVPLPDEVDTIVDHIPDDYHKAYFGKWHLGDEIGKRRGFDEWHPIEDLYRVWSDNPDIENEFSPYHHYLISQGYEPNAEVGGLRVFSRPFAHDLPEEHTKASYLGREVSKFLERNQDNPFALYVNFLEPHFPYTGPLNDYYDPESIPQSPIFMEDPADTASLMHQLMAQLYKTGEDRAAPTAARELRGEAISKPGEEESDLRQIQARYAGLVTLLDRAIEKILNKLDELGLAENTIVVFTSEHGDQLGDHYILHKMVMYEDTVRVPMLIRVPWLEGRRIPGRYSHIDTVPTLLDLMGFEIPDMLQGESKADVIAGNSTLDDNDVIIAWHGRGLDGLTLPMSPLELQRDIPHRVIITSDGWKLNLAVGDFCELYNLNDDPYETINLFYDEQHGEIALDLARRIRAWQDRNNDRLALPDIYPGVGYVAGMR